MKKFATSSWSCQRRLPIQSIREVTGAITLLFHLSSTKWTMDGTSWVKVDGQPFVYWRFISERFIQRTSHPDSKVYALLLAVANDALGVAGGLNIQLQLQTLRPSLILKFYLQQGDLRVSRWDQSDWVTRKWWVRRGLISVSFCNVLSGVHSHISS